MGAGLYRPLTLHLVKVGLSDGGKVAAWKHTVVTQSIVAGTAMAMMIKDGVDPTSAEASCVGGTTITCTDQNRTAQRGSCVETPGPSEPPPPSPDSGNGTPPDTSCDDLRTFCATNCSNPASLFADCQTTASEGDRR